MYKFCPLFSGSSGNATYIGDEHEGVLVDAGINAKTITNALAGIGVEPSCVKAVFVTHEHSDHISGLRVFCNKHQIPVYSSVGTLEYLDEHGHLNGDFPVYQISQYADVGDFHIECFHTSHDVREPQGYSILLPNLEKVSVVTDTGVMTEEILDGILGSKTILLESNHDVGMVSAGSYPYPLKRRILGQYGHISNDVAAETALKLLDSGTEHIILGHLSIENNIPELAYQTTFSKLSMEGATLGKDYTLQVAERFTPTMAETWE